MLALAIIPLIGAVGAAVDYSRANSVRTAMQAALDVTALMLSQGRPEPHSAQLGSKATDYFNAVVQPAGGVQRPGHCSSSPPRSRAASPST